ncbi:hypothetical protein ACO1O0_008116 [Amphichorda felina]
MATDHIDSLLERYLALLDEYTRLRDRLSRLQSGVYHNIARANFSAERGLRYGQDQYDDRMQASRLLRIQVDGGGRDGVPSFGVADAAAATAAAETDEDEDKGEDDSGDKDGEEDVAGDAANGDEKKEEPSKPVNPLRWFGILAPMPLRNAQGLSVETIEQVVPRLVTVNAEMLNLEIEVRRARKKRAKTEQQKSKTEAAALETESTERQNTATPVEAS